MDIELDLKVSGDVVERQELLNGTQIVTFEGQSVDGRWEISGLVTWSMRSSQATEGDITLARDDGAEVFATLTEGAVSDEGEGSGAHRFALAYEIDGGAGAFADASGALRASGTIEEATFEGRWFASDSDAGM
jgi:hypothetical protein